MRRAADMVDRQVEHGPDSDRAELAALRALTGPADSAQAPLLVFRRALWQVGARWTPASPTRFAWCAMDLMRARTWCTGRRAEAVGADRARNMSR